MTTKTSVFSKAVTAIAVLFSVAAVILRAILMTTYNDAEGFYTDKTLQDVLNYMLAAFAVIVFAAAYIYIKEGKIQISLPEGRVSNAFSVFAACVFGGFIVYSFGKLVIGRAKGGLWEKPSGAELVMALFCVVAMLFFISGKSQKLGDARALLCSGSALVLLALVFGIYFDLEISYINHSVVLCYAACIFLMLAIVAEANSYLGRPWLRRYLAFAPTAVVLSFALTIPDFIYAVLNLASPISDIYYDFIIFAMGVYHLVKLIRVSLVKFEEVRENKDEKTAGN